MATGTPSTAPDEAGNETHTGGDSPLRQGLRRFKRDRLAVACLATLILLGLIALFADYVAPYHYAEITPDARLTGPSINHPLGTDQHGRDIFSRIIYGTRVSFLVGLISISIAMSIGIPLGAIAAWKNGTTIDELIMRSMDIILSFPSVVLAIALIGVLGIEPVDLGMFTLPNVGKVMIVIGIITIPQFARTVRGDLLSELEEEYVDAAVVVGERWSFTLFREALPNVIASILVLASLRSATAILTEALLSFLGLGAQPPRPSWGLMLSEARNYMISGHWWMAIFPGLFIFVMVMALNIMGDSLRDAADPTME